MCKLLAVLLLFCVGIMIPAAASPVRICLLELEVNSTHGDSKCCPDCQRDTGPPDPCCLDLKELPDAPVPHVPTELPPVVMEDLPSRIGPAPITTECDPDGFSVSEPIRGPTSPAAYRAVLGIWRL